MQQEPNFTVIPQDAARVTYKLEEADVPGIQGEITMRDAGDMGVEAYIKLENTIEGIMHPVHIHEGLFGQGGDRKKTLNPVDGNTGISQTFFKFMDNGDVAGYDELVNNHEYYVGPHYSMDRLETIIAKGNIGINNPPIPCGPCDGKVDRLTFRYTGSETVLVTVIQKKDNVMLYHNRIGEGTQFTVEGKDKKGTLSTEVYILVNGTQVAQIHTSCSVPIGIGYAVDDFIIVDGSSRNGGPLCDISIDDVPPGCNTCDGKVDYLALEYAGENGVNLKLVQAKNNVELFNGTVDDGDVVNITGQDNQGTLSSKVYVYINGVQQKEIHTSCSQPIGIGSIFGKLEVVDGSSRNGGPLCPL
ncbi:hypothetical protein NMS_0309 [Nonlabens marinus S1-08]|uniref:DUF7467 domain-containing protein n=2 Tax=Nonlabens TaxID=363408 RepID=W8VU59_9FLAO|nr:hypothetical protein NMS_0309 [Nonlabens marinus S1-08]